MRSFSFVMILLYFSDLNKICSGNKQKTTFKIKKLLINPGMQRKKVQNK